MTDFRFIKVGRPAFSEYENLVSVYVERINHFVDCQLKVLKEGDPRQTVAKIKEAVFSQGSRSRGKQPPILVCLDEAGELVSSIQLSTKLRMHVESSRDVIFLIGGPYGIDAEILKMAQWRWCLSRSTLTSDMAWLVATEQVYRAITILNNQPYHHV